MKKSLSNFYLFIILISLSLTLYLLQILIFKRPEDTSYYFLQDFAFLPFHVTIVTLVIDRIISRREKKERLKKMNMAINAFFGEVGTELIINLNFFLHQCDICNRELDINGRWNDKNFKAAIKQFKEKKCNIDSTIGDFEVLKSFLISKRQFLLGMLENSNLLEHDTFSDMLWATFHLTDELVARASFDKLPKSDLEHLSLDLSRAYKTLMVEWINYLAHLKTDYPYLYSMAVRQNPFNENRCVIVE